MLCLWPVYQCIRRWINNLGYRGGSRNFQEGVRNGKKWHCSDVNNNSDLTCFICTWIYLGKSGAPMGTPLDPPLGYAPGIQWQQNTSSIHTYNIYTFTWYNEWIVLIQCQSVFFVTLWQDSFTNGLSWRNTLQRRSKTTDQRPLLINLQVSRRALS